MVKWLIFGNLLQIAFVKSNWENKANKADRLKRIKFPEKRLPEIEID